MPNDQSKPKRRPTQAEDIIGADGELQRPIDEPQKSRKTPFSFPQKGGSAFRPYAAEYHFSTALYIDDAIRALEIYVGKLNESQPQQGIRVLETKVIDADHARFKLKVVKAPGVTNLPVELVGTMQRWEGSRTRIDADTIANLPEEGFIVEENRPMNLMDRLMLLGIAAFLIGIASMVKLPFIMIVLIAVTLFAVLFANGEIKTTRKIPSKELSLIAQRSLDALTDVLIGAYKAHDVQWIDR